MDDEKYYLIYTIDVHQGKNTENIEIHPSLHNLSTTQKSVANTIIKSGITNDTRGSRHICMDNKYDNPQVFSLIESNYNTSEVGICRANRKGFDFESYGSIKKYDRGTFQI